MTRGGVLAATAAWVLSGVVVGTVVGLGMSNAGDSFDVRRPH